MGVFLQLNSIHKRYGKQVIFDGACASFGDEHKIGVIGRNGAGKTTLCRLLTREEEFDDGEIVRTSSLRLGYLEQQDAFESDETVTDFLVRYTGKEEWQCGKVAGRFQLKNELLDAKIGKMPGGYRTRVKIAAMLAQEPNFLVLDEPTNFLDLRTLLLFENFLKDYSGGFLIVSHDREFLKRTCTHTLEVENGQLSLFPAPVEDYLDFKLEQIQQVEKYNRKVEAQQKRVQTFIDRFRAKARRASLVQSRIKHLNKLQKIDIEHPIRNVRIRLPQVEPKKGAALRCQTLAIGYPEHTVADDIHLEVERGQHIAVLGDNGEGKTTFLRTIAGELSARAGEYQWGYGLSPAYYAQHVYETLNPGEDVLSYLERASATEVTRQEVLDLAGSLLFGGDEVRKPVSVLSGGERSRMCLAGLLLSRNPVLLLDEPTNHLDFETVEALGYALNQYNGTIFFTSHDRTFVNLVATGIVEVKQGKVRLYPADYQSYVYYVERSCADGDPVPQEAPEEEKPKEKSSYQQAKELKSRLRKLRSMTAENEARLAAHQQEREAVIRYFADNPTVYSREHSERLAELTRLIEEAETEWLELHEELESLESGG